MACYKITAAVVLIIGSVTVAQEISSLDDGDLEFKGKQITSLQSLLDRLDALEATCAKKADVAKRRTDVAQNIGDGKKVAVYFGTFNPRDTLSIEFAVDGCTVPGFTARVFDNPGSDPVIIVTASQDSSVFFDQGDVLAIEDGGMHLAQKKISSDKYAIGVVLGNFDGSGCTSATVSFSVSSVTGSFELASLGDSNPLSSSRSEDTDVQYAATLADLDQTVDEVINPQIDSVATDVTNLQQVVTDAVDDIAVTTNGLQESISGLESVLTQVSEDLGDVADAVDDINKCADDGGVHTGEDCIAVQRQCPVLKDSDLANGKWDGIHLAGTKTHAICDDGYYGVPSFMECKVDGTWGNPTPQCKTCPNSGCKACTADSCTTCSNAQHVIFQDGDCAACDSNREENVLLNQKYTVSSICFNPRLHPQYLNDGQGQRGWADKQFRDADYYHSCTETNPNVEIQVKGGKARIDRVRYHYRCDCCAHQNTNVQVYAKLAKTGQYVKCGGKSTDSDIQCSNNPPAITVQCPANIVATHIRIVREQRGYLVLPEVEAFGCPVN